MELCPKCKKRAIYFDEEPGFKRNVCAICGFSHCPKGYKQSMERQITGDTEQFGMGLEIFERKLTRDEYEQEEFGAHYLSMREYNLARKEIGVI